MKTGKIQVMKKYSHLTFFLLIAFFSAAAQENKVEEALIKQSINQLFEGMKKGDSSLTHASFSDQCIMQTIATPKNEAPSVKTSSLNDFLKFIGSPHKERFDERIVFTKILIDGPLASVWTDYKFYIDDQFSHCGVNSFQLFKGPTGWKVIYIIDTRRKENCGA